MVAVALTALAAPSRSLDPASAALLQRSFAQGREYFVLRSGRAKLIAQADQFDLAPAFCYLLFDAEDNRQSARKERAFNFTGGQGFLDSALEVELGDFPFTALGHQTRTRWTTEEGIPAAEAVWWSGGLRVTEKLLALGHDGLFLRRIELASVNLGGAESVKLRLRLPPGKSGVRQGWLLQEGEGCRIGLGAVGEWSLHAVPQKNCIEIGPLTVAPSTSVRIDTLLLVQMPSRDEANGSWSPLSIGQRSQVEARVSSDRAIWIEPISQPKTALNWARPSQPADRSMASILVGYSEPLRYRIFGAGTNRFTLVFGVCEGYHQETGQRILAMDIENRPRKIVDPIAEAGQNVPLLFALNAQDEDADGFIDINIAAAEMAKDKNPILNALWVFKGNTPPLEDVLTGSQNLSAAAFIHARQPQTTPLGELLPALELGGVLARTRAWWAVASSIDTDDLVVQDLFDKARFGLPAMVADNGVMDAGIFEYGAQWVRDTSNTLLGLLHAGHFEQVRRGLAYLLERMVNAEGNTMIAGSYDDPDREQFDQMGELIHVLKAYRDWTGDDSLIREHRIKLLAMIERPLRPEFRDGTGMVHNRREFWERTLDDAYELAYQTYVILGLRDAAALAEPLGATDRASPWKAEADRIQEAMLNHPTRALVAEGHLIKRRSVNGERVQVIRFPPAAPDVPLQTERVNLAEPDATMALPIAFRLIDGLSPLARNTLDEIEKLWNARWFGGGYERYHSSGQCDQPGPWPFASCFILRGQHEARMYDRSRRTLEWLNTVQGGRTGAWFEEIPLVRSQAPTAGIIPWTSGEISLFIVRHLLGARFEGQTLVLSPSPYPGSPPVRADLRFRSGRLKLELPGPGPFRRAVVNGQFQVPDARGAIRLPSDFAGGTIRFQTGQ
ncbi:MAG TPA: hypothetical protein P5186_02495 [Candidatus Paceibacterota bacterium]|nr:hypothetical protein [Verrucomicrobiota bacterium]HRY46892.1 hypothetical protein [Candidatus Paceibacterota bacterium]